MTAMGPHEGRLRAMIDPSGLADWGLNAEDREAIAWALDAIDRLKAERDELRQEHGRACHANYERWNEARAAAGRLARIFASPP